MRGEFCVPTHTNSNCLADMGNVMISGLLLGLGLMETIQSYVLWRLRNFEDIKVLPSDQKLGFSFNVIGLKFPRAKNISRKNIK